MSTLREDPREYQQAILRAAAEMNVPEQVIEKDYWITQILREIRRDHFGKFIMKGGTSLSKGYGLIQRFSEDVDLLIIPQSNPAEVSRVDEIMRAFESSAERVTGRDARRERAEEGVASVTLVPYDAVVTDYHLEFGPEVRIDHGVPGGPLPSEPREIGTLLGQGLIAGGSDVDEFDDLTTFSVPMLHPARTLVEKLCVVSSIGRRIADGNPAVRSREARHFYDIWCLLDEEQSPALQHLRTIDSVQEIFGDCVEITERFYGTTPERPDGGFAECVVFTEEVVKQVRKSYEKMCDGLIFRGAPRPTIDDVVERVRSHSSEL